MCCCCSSPSKKLDTRNKPLVDKYASLGLTNASKYVYTSGVNKGLINPQAADVALIRDVYGLDPKAYLKAENIM